MMAGDFAEFGPGASGPRLAIDDQNRWAAEAAQSLASLAHSRYFNAEADQKEQEARDDKLLMEHAQGAWQGGDSATTSSNPTTPASAARSLFDLANFAYSNGMLKKGTGLLDKGVDIAYKGVQIDATKALQEKRQVQAQREAMQQAASEALAVTDQRSYDLMRAYKASQGVDTSHWAPTYEEAKPLLDMEIKRGMSAIDQLKLREQQLVDGHRTKQLDAAAANSGAQAKAAGARKELLEYQLKMEKKYGGDKSQSAHDLRVARTDAAKATTAAKAAADKDRAAAAASRDFERFPPPTAAQIADPTKREIGRAYSTPKGVLVWTKAGWTPLTRTSVSDGSTEDAGDTEGDNDVDE